MNHIFKQKDIKNRHPEFSKKNTDVSETVLREWTVYVQCYTFTQR